MAKLKIGCRFDRSGDIGTVKFIGPVPPTSGEWVGVEWDDPNRGKHDGTKDGVRYFTCMYPTGGSFIRPNKINAGVSICEAMRDRYADSSSDKSADTGMYFEDKKGTHRKLEGIGLEKVQKTFFEQLYKLNEVGLRGQLISSAGEPNELKSIAPNIVGLNLSRNLLSSWETVCDIVEQLLSLKILNLSENVLSLFDNALTRSSAFSNINTLVLNKCRLTWDQVLKCSAMWPNISELHLESNLITEMTSPPPGVFTRLECLNLSENEIKSWDSIRQLNGLPMLSGLFLNKCGFSDINVRPDELQHLKHISLYGNLFETLQVFNELNKLPAMNNLAFKNNPVNNLEDYRTMQELIVAKIVKLKMFNKTEVDQNERRSAELDYLRKYGLEWKNAGGHQEEDKNDPSEQFLLDHPRFMEIAKEHGPPSDNQLIKKSTAIKGNLIEVIIEAPVKPEFKSVKRRLPLSMTIGNLKLFIQKLTKIEVRKQRLVYVSKDNPKHIVPLMRDGETLNDVSIDPGDVIQVLDHKPDLDWAKILLYDRKSYALVYGPSK